MTTTELEAWVKTLEEPRRVMTLDYEVPEEWLETFSRATTTADWDQILRVTERCSPAVYFAAKKACAGRDSTSLKIKAHREAVRDMFDSM